MTEQPKYTPQQIEALQEERMKETAKAIEGGAQVLFIWDHSDQIERARREMEEDNLTPEAVRPRLWETFEKLDEFLYELRFGYKTRNESKKDTEK